MARQVADILRLRDPDLLPAARLWKFLLQDLHPELHVELNETRRDIGVCVGPLLAAGEAVRQTAQ